MLHRLAVLGSLVRIGGLRTVVAAGSLCVLASVIPAGALAATGPQNSSPPAVAGTARDGSLLKAHKGRWSGTGPITYAYQWYECAGSGEDCASIEGATRSTLRVAHGDVGQTLAVTVRATDSEGSTALMSAPSAVVLGLAPKRRHAPTLTGVDEDGQVLSVSGGTWLGTPPLALEYRWETCGHGTSCTIIAGATSSTYRVGTSQIGSKLRAIVTASNAEGSAAAISKASGKIAAGPPVNVGSPAISGSLREGATLTASPGAWVGTPPFSYAYQWVRCGVLGGGCEPISGATQSTYSLGAADVASTIAVRVTTGNAQGAATAESPETNPILALLPENTLAPSISGLLQDGQLLTVATGTWTGTQPISFSYQWQICNPLGGSCSNITGATGETLSLSPADIGSTLQVIVKATNSAGTTTITTPITGLITGLLPKNTALPSISGLLQEGGLLSVASGTWTGSQPITYTYQWQLCNSLGQSCSNITGATGETLGLLAADIGSTVDVIVTATNAAGATSVTTPASELISGLLPKNTVLPSISGLLQEGALLSATSGSWSGTEPITYTYQWQLCNELGGSCSNITGATGETLSLTAGDIGSTLQVIVKATNTTGTTTATTPITGLITGLLPKNTALPSVSGLLQEGGLLSVASGTWTGTQPITYTYQWQLCNSAGQSCSNITGATGETLSLSPADIGSTLQVIVKATNATGSTTATTPITGLITGLLPKNTALPSVSGLLQEGGLLSVASGTWTGTQPITYSYQWQLCNSLGQSCSNITGATGETLSLSPADIGSTLQVIVKATNATGTTTATTPITGLITGLLPKNTALPSISGLLLNGQLLSVTSGSWTGTQPITYTYQWQLCNALGGSCANISGATGSSLQLAYGDVGGLLDVVVKATNVAGSTSVTSPLTGLIGL